MENLCPAPVRLASALAISVGLSCIARRMLIPNRPAAGPGLLKVTVSVAVNEVSRWLVAAARAIAWRGASGEAPAPPHPAARIATTASAPARCADGWNFRIGGRLALSGDF